MLMRPSVRRFALVAHVACSVGTVGAVAAFLALASAGVAVEDAAAAGAAYPAMELIALFVIVPLVAAALLTGLVQALGTSWGLFRHWWVLIKLMVTLLVAIVLLLRLGLIASLADAGAAGTLANVEATLRWSPVIHAGGGLLVLFVPLALSLYKPRGLTPYGWRRQQEERATPH